MSSVLGSTGATPESYRVISVVDGDTLHADINGTDEKVRIIGIDSPEVSGPAECFGQESTDYARAILEGQSVQLIADPTQDDRDRYGRLLRHVILPDNTNFGTQLVAVGLAYEYTYDTPYQTQAEFTAAQEQSRLQGRGLWSPETCNGQRAMPHPGVPASDVFTAPPEGVQTPAPAAASQNPSVQNQSGCDIKGNISFSSGEKIYHVRGQSTGYDATRIDASDGERMFCSVAEAEAAGWRAPRN